MDSPPPVANIASLTSDPSKSWLHKVRSNIIIGLMLIAPLGLTLWIVIFLFESITGMLLPKALLAKPNAYFYRIISLIIVGGILFMVGLLTRNLLGKYLYKAADRILSRLPVINTIYLSIRQVSETIASSRNLLLKEAVIIQFPRTGLYSIGFITGAITPNVIKTMLPNSSEPDCVMVCIPTTPNPTTGFLMIVPRSEIIPTNLTISEAMKTIISVGTVLPGSREAAQNTSLMDSVDLWMGKKAND